MIYRLLLLLLLIGVVVVSEWLLFVFGGDVLRS